VKVSGSEARITAHRGLAQACCNILLLSAAIVTGMEICGLYKGLHIWKPCAGHDVEADRLLCPHPLMLSCSPKLHYSSSVEVYGVSMVNVKACGFRVPGRCASQGVSMFIPVETPVLAGERGGLACV
jgi:hypothetical protein